MTRGYLKYGYCLIDLVDVEAYYGYTEQLAISAEL